MSLTPFDVSSCSDIEDKYVKDVYEAIASHFDSTRYKPWKKVKKFVMDASDNDKLCEIGFGNAKNMMLKPTQFKGCDICENFIKIGKEKGLDVQFGDQTDVPYDDNSFDKVLSIAVIHHLSTHKKRMNALEELIRITKVGGLIMVQAWALPDGEDTSSQDKLVSWTKKDKSVYQRYYHFFVDGEFEELVAHFDNVTIVESFFDCGNYGLIIKKTR